MKCVLLHGLGQSPSSWDAAAVAMGNGMETVCPDLFALLQGEEVNYASLYRAFCASCEADAEPFDLCGLSLGGVLALHYAIEHPARVHALALVGAQYAMPKRLLQVQNAVFRLMPARAFAQMGMEKRDVIRLCGSMMALDFSRELHRLTCPVLAVCGEKDRANMRAAVQLCERIPQAERMVIPGAGHEVNVDAPERLGEALRAFFGGRTTA